MHVLGAQKPDALSKYTFLSILIIFYDQSTFFVIYTKY